MNRGFAFYFKNAIKSSAAAIWKNKSILPVIVYFLAGFVAKVTIIFSAIFSLADIRQAKIVDESKRFDIPQTFKVATKSKTVWTMVLSIIAEAFIFLGGVLIIAAITCVLALIGYAVCWLIEGPDYIVALFCIPGGFGLLVYTLLMCLIFSPTPYIIETNPNLGVSETVKICFDTMKGRGKFTAFMNFFIPTLLEGFVIAICIVGCWFIPVLIDSYYLPVILVAWIIFSLVLIFLLIPMFDLTKKIAQKSLFEDIVLDTNRRTNGINIKMCKGAKLKPSEDKGNLVALFDGTQSDSIPEPYSPVRKKIKERAEKAAAEIKKEEVNEQPVQPQPEEPVNEQPAQLQPEETVKEQPVQSQHEDPINEQPVQLQPEEPVNEQQENNSGEQPIAEEPPKKKRTVRKKTSD